MRLTGRCHCGNLSFELRWASGAPTQIPARACGCSFCVKHGGVWTSSPGGSLRVWVRDESLHRRYAFGTKTADFHVCAQCGVVPVVSSLIEGRRLAVVSVNALEGLDPALLNRGSADFDGEGLGDRLARRQRNWIAEVEFLAGSPPAQ
ncbi:hypothetical protein [Pelomonas sp. SE-A7]|uniref:GFA family protein n=1 Tax=Pelomonas sp. SE-A7 TaxID=3054953 RepID=UPI00259CD7E7|nr:hypothetical protein [Pelomonas sp. SE-A7]MDM4765931.1 hypothetical protein [Pelomonas sp. SE-A7]